MSITAAAEAITVDRCDGRTVLMHSAELYFQGMRVCVRGDYDRYTPSEIKSFVKIHGGTIIDSVSKSDICILGNNFPPPKPRDLSAALQRVYIFDPASEWIDMCKAQNQFVPVPQRMLINSRDISSNGAARQALTAPPLVGKKRSIHATQSVDMKNIDDDVNPALVIHNKKSASLLRSHKYSKMYPSSVEHVDVHSVVENAHFSFNTARGTACATGTGVAACATLATHTGYSAGALAETLSAASSGVLCNSAVAAAAASSSDMCGLSAAAAAPPTASGYTAGAFGSAYATSPTQRVSASKGKKAASSNVSAQLFQDGAQAARKNDAARLQRKSTQIEQAKKTCFELRKQLVSVAATKTKLKEQVAALKVEICDLRCKFHDSAVQAIELAQANELLKTHKNEAVRMENQRKMVRLEHQNAVAAVTRERDQLLEDVHSLKKLVASLEQSLAQEKTVIKELQTQADQTCPQESLDAALRELAAVQIQAEKAEHAHHVALEKAKHEFDVLSGKVDWHTGTQPAASAAAEGSDTAGFTRTTIPKLTSAYQKVEANFHASLAGMEQYSKLKFAITKVEAVDNQRLREQFGRSLSYFYTQGYPSSVVSVYHGTHPNNISNILRDNLKVCTEQQVDMGWFGRGFYFSAYADYTFMYKTTGALRRVRAGDNFAILGFDILPGRTDQLKHITMGASRTLYKDSHVSPNGFEHIMFDPRHVNPTHVIHISARHAPGLLFEGAVEQTGAGTVASDAHVGSASSAAAAAAWEKPSYSPTSPSEDNYEPASPKPCSPTSPTYSPTSP